MLFLNELSLESQFESAHAFLANLRLIMQCRRKVREKGYPMQVRRSILNRAATPTTSFSDAIYSCGDRDFTRQVQIWLMKDGPFWDDARQHGEKDWFDCLGEPVTDSCLAEATWIKEQGDDAALFGFENSRFNECPLSVWWRDRADGDKQHLLPNFWEIVPLDEFFSSNRILPETWDELVKFAVSKFQHLDIPDTIIDTLDGRPFVAAIAKRALELLRVLDELNESILNGSKQNETEILGQYFTGSRSWFSGESEGRKNNPRVQKSMTFLDPRTETDLYCPWHGKISHQYFRLHFEWPKTDRKSKLLIVYLGPHF